MSIIGAKRMQQGIFEALASQNRAAGSGAGAGFAVLQVLGSTTNVTVGSTGGNSAWQTATATKVTFSTPRTVRTLVLAAAVVYDPLNGDTGFDLATTILVDGTQDPTVSPVYDNFTGSISTTLFGVTGALPPGTHTAAIGVSQTTGHNWAIGGGYVFVFQLGA